MKSLAFALLPLLAGCVQIPAITEAEVKNILNASADAASARFGKKACIVTTIAEISPPLPEKQPLETDWVNLGNLRYRNLRHPIQTNLPREAVARLQKTSDRFGCPESFEIEQPLFVQIDRADHREVLAFVNINRLCGPQCGEQYSVEFTKRDSGWSIDHEGLKPTGIAF